MEKLFDNSFAILRMIFGVGVFLAPGLLGTWIVFALAFSDTLNKDHFSQLETVVFIAGVVGISYLASIATPWRRVQNFIAPLWLYDEWLSTRGD